MHQCHVYLTCDYDDGVHSYYYKRGYMFTFILQFSCTTSSCRTQDKLDVMNCL